MTLTLLFYLLTAYLFAVLCSEIFVHLPRRHFWRGSAHYLILLHNSQHRIEWVLRTLYIASKTEGKDFSLTCVDYGSTDHTLDIVRRMTGNETIGSDVDRQKNERLVVIDLRRDRPSFAAAKGEGGLNEK